LADNATKDYQEFENNRKKTLATAQQRARSVYSLHVQGKKEDRQTKYEENVINVLFV
jgi:hypothetical protein